MSDLKNVLPLFIPIVAIVMGIGIGMLALWLENQKKLRMFELLHQERLFALERGLEVPPLPPEFFAAPARKDDKPAGPRVSSLRWGLMWLFLGLALAIAITLNDGVEQASWALLPVAVGVAQLIYYQAALANAKQLAAEPPAPPAPVSADSAQLPR